MMCHCRCLGALLVLNGSLCVFAIVDGALFAVYVSKAPMDRLLLFDEYVVTLWSIVGMKLSSLVLVGANDDGGVGDGDGIFVMMVTEMELVLMLMIIVVNSSTTVHVSGWNWTTSTCPCLV